MAAPRCPTTWSSSASVTTARWRRGNSNSEGLHMSLFRRRRAEGRSLPAAENQLPLVGAYTASPITPAKALAVADVWAAVRVLADAASSLPVHVFRKTADGRERVTSGRLVDHLDRPSPGTSQADLVSSLMS